MLLPSGRSETTPTTELSTLDAMSAARATVSDLGQFCERQPTACAVGGQAMVAIGQRAQAGAKMLYEFLTEQVGPVEGGTTGDAGAVRDSQQTLTPDDKTPPWRDPRPARDSRERPA